MNVSTNAPSNVNDLLNWLAIDPRAASIVCLTLLHSLWITATISVIAWAINRTATRKSVEGSYLVCVAAMIASLLLTAWMGWTVSTDHTTGLSRTVTAHPANPSQAIPLHLFGPNATAHTTGSSADALATPVRLFPRVAYFGALPSNAWTQFAPWVAITYFAGLLCMALRLSSSMWRAHRLPRTATPIEAGPVREVLEQVAKRWSLRTKVLLKQTEEIAVPKIVGLLRPTILIPTAAITGLTPIELEMLLVHEVAHVRRNDLWINLLQRISETVLFFNPFIWLLSRRISAFREYCCDDMTCRSLTPRSIAEEQARSRYATALFKVAEMAYSNQGRPRTDRLKLTALAASGRSPSELRRRIARLVGQPLRDTVSLSRSGILLAVTMATVIVCLPRVTQSATLAEFQQLGLPISTVVGPNGNAFLKNVSATTGGKHYIVRNINALPKIMQREARRDGSLIIDAELLNELAAANQKPPVAKADVPAANNQKVDNAPPPNQQPKPGAQNQGQRARRARQMPGGERINREELNINEILGRICRDSAKPDPAYLATLQLQLPAAAQATTYEIGNKEAFFRKLTNEVDTISGESGLFEDILASLKDDPTGPQIDGREVIKKQLGNRLTCVTLGTEELWIWQIEPALPSAAFQFTFKKFVSADPVAHSLNETKNLWSFNDIDDQDNTMAPIIAAAATDGHLWVASDVKLLQQVAPAFAN